MRKGIGAFLNRALRSGTSWFDRRIIVALLALFLLPDGLLWSQQQQQQTTQTPPPPSPPQQTQSPPPPPHSQSKISAEVKFVTVYATVRDKHGKIVPNLNQSDFILAEDTRPQTIKYFARESDLPLTLGLLVDTSLSQRRLIEQERTASYSFFDHTLRPKKDKGFLIHFDREVELLQDLTTSREKLRSSLNDLQTPEPDSNRAGSGSGRGSGGAGRSHHGGGTLLYDSVYLASNELMKKQQGRKAVIVLTDGVDRGSKVSLNTAIESAQRADTAVYSILFADEEGYGRAGGYGGHGGYGGGGMGRPGGGQRRYPREDRPDGKKVLARISKETGGQFFQVSKKHSIDQIYAQIEEELRNQYSLGYTPNPATAEDTYHLIHLTTNQKDLTVQAREGYYAGP
ncbi:MAG: VWA domain-containing protein [Candidatus Acidiferrales bacterium]